MRTLGLIARVLLGLMFTFFGLNGFLHFLHMSPPAGLAGQYMAVMTQSHYFNFVYGLQLLTGILLLAGIFVPLALVLLAPVIVNILLFHALMDPSGILPGAIAAGLWFIVFLGYIRAFQGLFQFRRATRH